MSLIQFSHRPNVNSFLDEFFTNDWFPATTRNSFVPAVNVQEGEKEFVLELAVPGKTKNDFEIELDQDVLTIASVEDQANDNQHELFTRKEFNFNAFKRSFTLPESINTKKIKANYTQGILRVALPKRKEAIPQPSKKIAIE